MQRRNQRPPQSTQKPKGEKGDFLLALLANAATADSRRLLKKYGRPDANNYADLEFKLGELYMQAPDKVVLEKEMAEIHPHKDWILKNFKPKVELKADPIKVEAPKTDLQEKEPIKTTVLYENLSAADGLQNVQQPIPTVNSNTISETVLILGVLGIVAIAGMVIYAKPNN